MPGFSLGIVNDLCNFPVSLSPKDITQNAKKNLTQSANRSNRSQVTSLHVLSTFGSTVPRPRAADLTPCHLRRRPAFSSVHGGADRLLLLACLAPKQQYPILLHCLSQPPTQPLTYHPKPRQSCRQQGSTLLLSQEQHVPSSLTPASQTRHPT